MTANILVIQGDIVQQRVDAIVNAANRSLLGGSGVDGAIHRTSGPELLEECKTLEGCNTGDAKITKGYRLSAKWIVHTVGPVWRGGKNNEDALLASAYRRSLDIARKVGARTIAFPSIATGAYGFPLDRAARIAIETIRSYIENHAVFDEIRLVCFDPTTLTAYQKALTKAKTV